MADRAQFTTHTLVRWIVTAGVALFVLALVGIGSLVVSPVRRIPEEEREDE